MLADMRAGTYPVAAMPQTAKPGSTWHVTQDTGAKSAGAQDVPSPDDPGGDWRPSRASKCCDASRRIRIRSRCGRRANVLVVDGAQVLEGLADRDGEAVRH